MAPDGGVRDAHAPNWRRKSGPTQCRSGSPPTDGPCAASLARMGDGSSGAVVRSLPEKSHRTQDPFWRPRFANLESLCPARLQRKSAAEGHFYSPPVSPPFTPGGVELGRLGGCGAGARVATLLVGRPKTVPALGRVHFVPGVAQTRYLACHHPHRLTHSSGRSSSLPSPESNLRPPARRRSRED